MKTPWTDRRSLTTLARYGMPLAKIDAVGLVCGPGTTREQFQHLRALGIGWVEAVNAWQQTEATYCFFLAHAEDDVAEHAFARPIIFCTHDRALLEQSVWSAASHDSVRACVLDSLDPDLDEFVERLKGACRLPPGHA